MKNYILLIMMIFALSFLSACSGAVLSSEMQNGQNEMEVVTISAEYPLFGGLEDMVSRSTEIVKAEVLDKRVEKIDTRMPPLNDDSDQIMIYTVYRINVLEVYKGDVKPGDTMEVKQLGGQLDNVRVISNDEISLETRDDLILFLESYGSYGREYAHMPASLLNPTQAAYRFMNSDGRPGGAGVKLESLSPKNVITLTLEDLKQISERR